MTAAAPIYKIRNRKRIIVDNVTFGIHSSCISRGLRADSPRAIVQLMLDTPNIFDRELVRLHRDRAALEFAAHDFLIREVGERLSDRLLDIARNFPLALDLGAKSGVSALCPVARAASNRSSRRTYHIRCCARQAPPRSRRMRSFCLSPRAPSISFSVIWTCIGPMTCRAAFSKFVAP